MKTCRYRGHSMSDPAKYRSKEEVEEYKTKHDPIERLKRYITENKIKPVKMISKSWKLKIKDQIKEAGRFCA